MSMNSDAVFLRSASQMRAQVAAGQQAPVHLLGWSVF